MKYRHLGKTGLKVSVIGMGTWQFGGEWGKNFSQDEVDRMFDAARQRGVNLIDTAECYGDHLSEKFIGTAVHRDRDHWIIATKFGHKFHGYMNRTDERSPADAIQQVEDSLRALRTDYIDLLQYHSVRDSEFANDELTAVLQNLVRSRKVRHLGNSISNTAIDGPQVEASTSRNVEVVQVIYNRLDLRPESRAFASCCAQGLGVLARVPLASGYLSGKYKPGTTFVAGDVRSGHDPAKTEQILEQVEEIRRTEVPAGVEMAVWALAWCLQHPAVTAVIPGCKNVDQVVANASAAGLPLVREDHPQAWKQPIK
jgi:aryl-alcohol dehydrogenase-like predicted oxidoreductase